MKKLTTKLCSVKTWALIFCCWALGYIIIKNKSEFIDLAKILAYAPVSYFIANVAEDFIFKNQNMFKRNNTIDNTMSEDK